MKNNNIQASTNSHNLRQQTSQKSKSSYPSSLLSSSRNTAHKISHMEHLSDKQEEIVSNYLASTQTKRLKQLLMERDQFLQELHAINNQLNQMIGSLYGDLQTQPQGKQKEPQGKQKEENQLEQSQSPAVRELNLKDKSRHHRNYAQQLKKVQKLSQLELNALQTKNHKLIQSLHDQLADFQFMLTGKYIDQLDQQIHQSQTLKKQLQFQVALINKQINKFTKAFDQQTITKFQKATYDAQIQLTSLQKKLQSRLTKLNSYSLQIQQKSNKIQALYNQQIELERLLQMYEDEQYEGEQTTRKKRENYDKLQIKKQKLQKIINSYNNNHLKLYNKKLCDFRAINQKLSLLKETIKQMDYKIVLATRERKQFELQNKNALSSKQKFSSLIHPLPKPALKIRKKSTGQNTQILTQQRLPGQKYSISKRNRLKFLRAPSHKQTPGSSVQNETLHENQINQPHDLRRRIYTELESSHYFASIQKKGSSKNIQKSEGVNDGLSRVTGEHKKKGLMHSINKNQIYIPTNDRPMIGNGERFDGRQLKMQQKKFNLSNTPLSNADKDSKKEKSFEFYDKSNRSQMGDDSEEVHREQHEIYQKLNKGVNRKGVSHHIERGSEDEIQKRLIYLENLLKKGHTQKLSENQVQQQQLMTQQHNPREYNKSKIEKNNDKLFRQKSGRSSPNLKQQIHPNQIKKNPGKHYLELCQKLGKDKLLIEEDQDISALIYQGMNKHN